MTRTPKSPFQNQMAPTWAQNGAAHPSRRTGAEKLASGGHGFLRVDEAAIHLNVSEKTVRRLIKARALSVIRIGRLIRIQRREIERFLAAACFSANKPQNLTEEDGHE